MPRKIEYKCCICHNQLENKDTIRLCKQSYGINQYGGHYTVKKYDFCKECYGKFAGWIKKHNQDIVTKIIKEMAEGDSTKRANGLLSEIISNSVKEE